MPAEPRTVPPALGPSPSGPADRPGTGVARASERGGRIVAVTIAAAWHVAIGLPAVLGGWPDLAAPVVVAAGWLVTAGVGALTAGRLLTGRRVPVRRLSVLLLAVDVTVFAAVGPDRLFTAANWVWSTLGWFFVLVCWGRRVTGLVVLLGAHSTIALGALFGHGATDPADLARYAMYGYGTASLPVAVFFGSAAITSLARQRAEAAATAHAATAQREAAERARRDRRGRLALVADDAGAVLAELAAGRADPTDPRVQRRCALAAARLRRLIAESDDVPDPLLHELRAAADLAERHGIRIDLATVGVPPALPVRIRRRLAEPLTTALVDARGWARLTVVCGPDEVVVGLVTPDHGGPTHGVPEATGPPDPGPDDDHVTHLDERDGTIRWTQTRWRSR
ncbi:hypothetical protein AWW66_21330 [Micromonospora rosaria]|uniref:Uncharacterized protein n=1 Tax=Micromonospora rosaria TaxID=47874 RepID=A0A136PNG4_9ACTN|nr:hypothetical protein [Micromonospora rosaria]KXK59963.1 hypothetical protein AWW66_21330 [Micromonospora rosaria]